ncbi:hypothetical protein JRO89_XS12G0025700 [Xanthoceras sorbifolium]|uniref:Membrane magnesium transporter n=1 Tax=Xanthoceras sorbifolium TaxID=99658 RepID=A0ABQ8HAN0_9ROSI|nr:hypothetical protein JRO89_XS12G0025700 [Xanthoceras sorbifolium]
MGLGFVVGIVAVAILAHAAYSTIQYRGLLKITEEEFSGPPMNVVVELLLGLVLCMWAALTVPGKFLSIKPDTDENRCLYALLIMVKHSNFCRNNFNGFFARQLGLHDLQPPWKSIFIRNGYEAENLRWFPIKLKNLHEADSGRALF